MKAITLSPQDFATFTSDKLVKVLQVIEHSTKELVTVIFDRVKLRTQKTTEFEISLEVHQSFEVKLPARIKTEEAAREFAVALPDAIGVGTSEDLDGGDLASHVYDVLQTADKRWTATISSIYSTLVFHEASTVKQAKQHGNRLVKFIHIMFDAEIERNLHCKIKPRGCVRKVLAG